jgi:hypothetical protein
MQQGKGAPRHVGVNQRRRRIHESQNAKMQLGNTVVQFLLENS